MASHPSQPVATSPAVRFGLSARIISLALLFGVEAIIASILFDGATRVPAGAWLTDLIHVWGPWVARCAIGFAALSATFAYLRYRPELADVSAQVGEHPIDFRLVAGHFAAIALFGALSVGVYGGSSSPTASNLLSAGWIFAAVAAVCFAGFAVVPWKLFLRGVKVTGALWAYAAGASVLACSAGTLSASLWTPASRLAFRMVTFFLQPFVRDLVVQPAAFRIGTHRFTVVISEQCSGLEGLSLLLVFGVVWLVLFRDEVRFPQALLLLPVGLVVLFVLNGMRIAALVLIGDAGAKEIARGGFHSQAGWIAFNLVSFGLALTARRIPWISAQPRRKEIAHTEANNPTAAYLLPFLAILAAGMASRASSGDFEWLYSLRFVAALSVLWVYRRSYSEVQWRFGWLGPAIGVAVFAVWIGFDALMHRASVPMPSSLSASPMWSRVTWITLRVLSAVVTVPMAEELAFRGFLLRRFIHEEFEAVSFRSFTALSVAASSVLFGLMHGQRWPAGIVAGICYAAAMLRRGRLGDAVAAHATTNALIAFSVLYCDQWQLW